MDKPLTAQRNAALDGVRAIAALSVMAAHYGLFGIRNAQIGVDIFFVLSGFLITRILLDDIARFGRIRFSRFYWRRALRLIPALVFVVSVFVAVDLLLNLNSAWSVALAAGSALTYTTNWVRALGLWDTVEFAHAWTLSVEEQFYLTWPLLLALATPLLGKRTRLAAVVVAAVALYFHVAHLIATGAGKAWLDFALDTRANALLVGVAAALALDLAGRRYITSKVEAGIFVGAIAGCAVVTMALIVLLPEDAYFLLIEPLVELGSALVFVHLVVTARSPLKGALSFGPLVALGTISYGIYLWHYPVWIVFWEVTLPLGISEAWRPWLNLGIVAPLALVGAALSYRYVERPFLAMKDAMSGSAGVRSARAEPELRRHA